MAFDLTTRGRCWVGTIHINNMIKAGLTKEQYENPEFLGNFFVSLWEKSGKGRKAAIAVCMSLEGCYHCHIACYSNTTTLKKVSEVLCQSHVEPQLGGKEELKKYILKQGKYAEKGEQVLYSQGVEVIEEKQGARRDLDEIETLLNEGYSPEQIYEESFRYRRYEKMIKAHYLQLRIKSVPLVKKMNNEYHFGASGSGKTYTYIRLCEKYSIDEVYLCNDYANSGSSGGGFDFYTNNPAKVIVLDEFRGGIPFSNLLSMLDVYSRNQQHARYQNTYALWESVIICSIYPPEEVYKFMVEDTQRNVDSIRQFMRRLNKIVYHFKDKEGKFRTYTMQASNYNNAQDIRSRAYDFEKNVTYEEYQKSKEKISMFEGVEIIEGGDIL